MTPLLAGMSILITLDPSIFNRSENILNVYFISYDIPTASNLLYIKYFDFKIITLKEPCFFKLWKHGVKIEWVKGVPRKIKVE